MSKKILILRSRIVAFPNAFWCSAPQLQNSILPSRWARNYSTWCAIQPRSLENLKLNPWFVTGFTYGEGCFHVSITKNQKFKVGWEVRLVFVTVVNEKDIALLEQIKNLFRVGSINYKQKSKSIHYKVSSLKDLKIIIDNFYSYPLKTKNKAILNLSNKYFILYLKKNYTRIT